MEPGEVCVIYLHAKLHGKQANEEKVMSVLWELFTLSAIVHKQTALLLELLLLIGSSSTEGTVRNELHTSGIWLLHGSVSESLPL